MAVVQFRDISRVQIQLLSPWHGRSITATTQDRSTLRVQAVVAGCTCVCTGTTIGGAARSKIIRHCRWYETDTASVPTGSHSQIRTDTEIIVLLSVKPDVAGI